MKTEILQTPVRVICNWPTFEADMEALPRLTATSYLISFHVSTAGHATLKRAAILP